MVNMLNTDSYPTLRLEVWLRCLLLSAVPILLVIFAIITLQSTSLTVTISFTLVGLALSLIALHSLRAWRSTARLARIRSASSSASFVRPFVKCTVVDADGKTRHEGRGWCLVVDDRLHLETSRALPPKGDAVIAQCELSEISNISATRVAFGWGVPQVSIAVDGRQISFEPMRWSGTPYRAATTAMVGSIAAELNAVLRASRAS